MEMKGGLWILEETYFKYFMQFFYDSDIIIKRIKMKGKIFKLVRGKQVIKI